MPGIVLALYWDRDGDAWVRYLKTWQKVLAGYDEIVVYEDGWLLNEDVRKAVMKLPMRLTYRFNREKMGLAPTVNYLIEYARLNDYEWMRLVSTMDNLASEALEITSVFTREVADEVGLAGPKVVDRRGISPLVMQSVSKRQTIENDSWWIGLDDVWIRVKTIWEVGGLDPNYYWRDMDVDMSARVLLEGRRLMTTGTGERKQPSSALEVYFLGRNPFLMMVKFEELLPRYRKWWRWLEDLVRDVVGLIRGGKWRWLRYYMSGVWDGIRVWRGVSPSNTS